MTRWPIIVLTLLGDEARRTPLLEKLQSLGLPYLLHIGIDGRQGLPADVEHLVDRRAAKIRNDRDLTDGELACTLSHRAIYERICDEGLPGAVVLEDDAIVDEAFAAFVAARAYEAADLIMLDHSHARVWGQPTWLGDESLARRLSLPSCLTTAYAISAAGAKYLHSAATPVADPADWPGDITALGALVIVPPIVSHPDPDTGVSHLRDDRKSKIRTRSSPKRFLSAVFWRRWIIKRLSKRVS